MSSSKYRQWTGTPYARLAFSGSIIGASLRRKDSFMRKALGAVAAIVASVLAAITLAPQAQALAVTPGVLKQGTLYMRTAAGSVMLGTYTTSTAALNLTDRPRYNNHRVVSVQFKGDGRCIDSLGTRTAGTGVRTHACNSGNYQWLEVFAGSVPGTIMLKSLGAWLNQGVHLCIQSERTRGSYMYWNHCSSTRVNTYQQFQFVA